MTSSITEWHDKEHLYLLTIIFSFPIRIIYLSVILTVSWLNWNYYWRCSNVEEREKVREARVVWEGRDYWRLGYTLCPRSGLASVQQVVLSSPLHLLSCHHQHQDPHHPHHTLHTRWFSSSHFICFKFLFLKFRRHIFFKNICVVFAKWMQKVFGYIFGFLKS